MFCALWFLTNVFAAHHTHYWSVQWNVGAPDSYPRAILTVTNLTSSMVFDNVETHLSVFGGPTLYVKQFDTLEIHVTNKLSDRVVSIHWHGLHQFMQAIMDGVPGVTQAGILPMHTFVYQFNITQAPGTFFYHSHSGLQSSDGFHGALVIQDNNDVQKEYVVALQDWHHELATTLFAKYTTRNDAFDTFMPDYPYPAVSVLINGKGQFNCSTQLVSEEDCKRVREWGWPYFLSGQNESMRFASKQFPWQTNGQCNPSRPPFFGSCLQHQPASVLECQSNTTLRLRLVGAGFSLGLRFWVDQHNLTIVAKDGVDIIPLANQEAVFLHAGERLDVLLECDQTPQTYVIYVAIAYEYYGKTAHLKSPNISSYAFLRYDNNDPLFEPQCTPEKWPQQQTKPTYFYAAQNQVSKPASQKFMIWSQSKGHWWNYETNTTGKRFEWWELNSVVPWRLSGFFDSILEGCKQGANWSSLFSLQPLTFHLTFNQTYEFVIVNNESQPHPWHIHGYTVDVLSIGALSELANLQPTNTSGTEIMRADTFVIPAMSFVQFRLHANNPGPWVAHCHMPYHAEVGMLFFISVEYDGKECFYEFHETTSSFFNDNEPARIFAILGIIVVLFPITMLIIVFFFAWIVRMCQRRQTLNSAYVRAIPLVPK